MNHTLVVGSASELNDLYAWSQDHAANPGTEFFLESVCIATKDATFPAKAVIPPELVDDVTDLIIDWEEILSNDHLREAIVADEPFNTHIEEK
jgi:hypothetical protein